MALRSTQAALVLPLVLGCSTADGLDTGSGDGETDGPPDPPEPQPVVDGDACGSDVFGWKTQCQAFGTISYQDPFDPTQYLEIAPYIGSPVACCEGNPSQVTADAACVDSCVAKLCSIAQDVYDQIAQENGWSCGLGCEFDLEGCMAGSSVQQFPHPPLGDAYPHEVSVSCEAVNVEPRRPDGTFSFIQSPEDFPYAWEPGTCEPKTQEAAYQPLASLVANTAHEDAGTYALATWWAGGEQGKQGTVDVEAELAYAVRPCGANECLEVTELHASIPPGDYAGLTVQSAALDLTGISGPPMIDRSGAFWFAPGSLQFELTAVVEGASFQIVRTNVAPVRGRLSHTADVFELSDVRFAHDDADFGAELRLDLVAAHTNRAPQAAIRRLDSPLDCDEPVVLQAASVDPDGDPMQHYWWTPAGMMQAPTAELVLPAGSHFVVLVSVDPRGAHDATSLTYKRSCT